ncbi:T9SS type A sorting domain-containing protein [Epilithonimonas sp. UC225_85]|uniref:T9SS type A sorting domain-containing protein n=1 Tax=Epilithonimonas sp. UC225_85 TaxID=3350167 RepID=UPI0036D2AEE2
MKKLLLIFILLIGVSFMNAQNVEFDDSKFKAYLVGNAQINTNGDNEIQISEAEAFTGTIDCNSRNITSLKGIEKFLNITELICYSNSLPYLILNENKKLTKINCYNNKITAINIINNIALTELICVNNLIDFIDTSNNVGLKYLYSSQNQYLSNLNLTNNTALELLYVSSTAITSLNLTQNKSLKSLDISSNQITNINLSENINLELLSCGMTYMTNIDLSKNVKLKNLYCFDNLQMTNLDVSKNIELIELSCQRNGITHLDVSKNTVLQKLYCQENQLTNLDVSKNTSLIEFSCFGNKITTIDVSKNPALTLFSVRDNQLNTLNVKNGNNNLISIFRATNNPNLTCIQVDNPTASAGYPDWQKDATATYNINCGLSVLDLNRNEIILHPNPVIDILNFSDDVSNIKITDISGKMVKQLPETLKSINVSNLTKGNYIINVTTKTGDAINKKFIKQ